MQKGINNLIEKFGASDLVERRSGLSFITVDQTKAVAAITHLKDIDGYTVLSFITAADWIEDGKMQLTYMLNNPAEVAEIAIRVMLERKKEAGESMETIHHLWPNAKKWQQELKEMYGVDFPTSPGVNDSFILEGWDDMPPNRRDFDTKQYAEDTFFPRGGRVTHDPATYMREQLDPKDPQYYTKKKKKDINS
ncbi:MAG: NADH-quinone oxidoreductase subunit C [Ichthyobacteriaceae bacterium]|nr:NADH-quinone oxidoreductase subunit C [Ichthyobacteriaceae bacterium]